MEISYQDYLLTDERSISPQTVKGLLDGSYWAPDRSLELIEKTIKNSICIGVFQGDKLIGFARIVTDKAVFAWIADVIDPDGKSTAPEGGGPGYDAAADANGTIGVTVLDTGAVQILRPQYPSDGSGIDATSTSIDPTQI